MFGRAFQRCAVCKASGNYTNGPTSLCTAESGAARSFEFAFATLGERQQDNVLAVTVIGKVAIRHATVFQAKPFPRRPSLEPPIC